MSSGEWPAGIEPSKAALADYLRDIEGWTYLDELWTLHEVVRNFPGRQPLTVVEIGSWKGRSTIALALGVACKGNGRVYAIDPHVGSREHREVFGHVDTFDDFVSNIRRAGVSRIVEPLRMSSHDASVRFERKSVDVLFVDGSHEYEDVLMDIGDWTPTLADKAMVAFNDPLFPGVYRALRESVLKASSPYRNTHYIANTLFFEFRRDVPWEFRDSALLLKLRVLLNLRFRAQGPASRAPKWAVQVGRRLYETILP